MIGEDLVVDHFECHVQMEFHFAQTKRKGPFFNVELQRGGGGRQGFDVFELPRVLGGINLALRSVIVLTLVSLQTQRLYAERD